MSRLIVTVIFTLGALFAVAAPAMAQGNCGERSDMVQQLQTHHKETQQAIGIASNGTLLEIFASPSGTWTVLMTYPNGKSCMMAIGEAWRAVTHQPGQSV